MADTDSSSNPPLADSDFPPFDRVEPTHVRPGVRALLARLDGELEDLEKGVEPAWECLVHPLERIVDMLDIVWNVVDHIKAVKDSPDLRAAVEDVQVVSSSLTPPVIWMDEAADLLVHHQMLSFNAPLLPRPPEPPRRRAPEASTSITVTIHSSIPCLQLAF
ncbi:hypothetical protein VPH35_070413 [Triticum aestivum]